MMIKGVLLSCGEPSSLQHQAEISSEFLGMFVKALSQLMACGTHLPAKHLVGIFGPGENRLHRTIFLYHCMQRTWTSGAQKC
jgi:hypothetical protein